MKELVSILIPILNADLTVHEETVLRHSLEALSKYPIILFTYEGADLSAFESEDKRVEVLTFKSKYFGSRQALSNLLLMEDFYTRFTWSDFVLIHELNSWIVKDEIHYWCKQGYDYLHANPIENTGSKNSIGNDFSRIWGLNENEKQELGKSFESDGLKLCNVQRMIKTLSARKKEAHEYRQNDKFENKDSLFWEIEANRFWPQLRKPTPIVQSRFSQNAKNISGYTDNRDAWPTGICGIDMNNLNSLPFYK
ncbi:hypothetical protein L0657_11470 [Dyadobacter sp. CY345]|uniref:DUF5672 family protein n=1 Tax=Dyadobacter sp. CY345 TaxID=2909335 RepID=UPI001F3BED58|nr:DUF5672 family protein [Dyadobacter sp. CY345]MCF2444577.1 hypothetical protein [Dyadobacter sp. CY345]